jgi:hypothetical protein
MNNKGFAAFILVVTISSLMLAFISIQSIEYLHFFDQVQRKQYRLMSYYFAYSCIDRALLTLSHDYFFTISTEIYYPDINCGISEVENISNNILIRVYGKYKEIIVYRRATATLYDDHLEVISIE